MKTLKVMIFFEKLIPRRVAYIDLTAFVNDNRIQKEDIVSITQDGSGQSYTLFYYA